MSPADGGLFSSPHLVDLVLAVLALEIVGSAFWYQDLGKIGAMATAALPGACILLALRSCLAGAGWWWVALWLAASFPAHLIDLWRRPP